MKITFLGTGTSQGVPVIACACEVCVSENKKDKRLRSSVLVELAGRCFIIDTGPDFRYQMLRENVRQLDAVIFTHEHKDHIAGLDDVRAFNHKQQQPIPIYADERTLNAIKREFYYAFSLPRYPGAPELAVHEIGHKEFIIADTITVNPIEVMHYKLPVKGFRILDFTYITDMKTISDVEKKKIEGTKILVLNALQQTSHISHLTLDEAIDFAQEINAEETYFTHISHKMGTHSEVSKRLPEHISLAYDGLKIELSE